MEQPKWINAAYLVNDAVIFGDVFVYPQLFPAARIGEEYSVNSLKETKSQLTQVVVDPAIGTALVSTLVTSNVEDRPWAAGLDAITLGTFWTHRLVSDGRSNTSSSQSAASGKSIQSAPSSKSLEDASEERFDDGKNSGSPENESEATLLPAVMQDQARVLQDAGVINIEYGLPRIVYQTFFPNNGLARGLTATGVTGGLILTKAIAGNPDGRLLTPLIGGAEAFFYPENPALMGLSNIAAVNTFKMPVNQAKLDQHVLNPRQPITENVKEAHNATNAINYGVYGLLGYTEGSLILGHKRHWAWGDQGKLLLPAALIIGADWTQAIRLGGNQPYHALLNTGSSAAGALASQGVPWLWDRLTSISGFSLGGPIFRNNLRVSFTTAPNGTGGMALFSGNL